MKDSEAPELNSHVTYNNTMALCLLLQRNCIWLSETEIHLFYAHKSSAIYHWATIRKAAVRPSCYDFTNVPAANWTNDN